MATAERDKHMPDPRDCHSFTLLLSGFDELTAEIENRLFDAGCEDATLGIQAGTPYLAFDRDAESFEEAMNSAIRDVEHSGLGIQVKPTAWASPGRAHGRCQGL